MASAFQSRIFLLIVSVTFLVSCERKDKKLNVEPKKGTTGTPSGEAASNGGWKGPSTGDEGSPSGDEGVDKAPDDGLTDDSVDSDTKTTATPGPGGGDSDDGATDLTPGKTTTTSSGTTASDSQPDKPDSDDDDTDPSPRPAPDSDKDDDKDGGFEPVPNPKLTIDSGMKVRLDEKQTVFLVMPKTTTKKFTDIKVTLGGSVKSEKPGKPEVPEKDPKKPELPDKTPPKDKDNVGEVIGEVSVIVAVSFKKDGKMCKGEAITTLDAKTPKPVMTDCK